MTNESLLHNLLPLAKRSFSNLSHDPDGRGERTIQEFSTELENDIADIMGLHPFGTKWAQSEEQKKLLTETLCRYAANYEKYLSAWLSSQSNCASSFITGGSNFPVTSQQKRHRWADNHYNSFRTWRTRALKAIKKFYTPSVDALTLNRQKLADALKLHSFMKLVNSAHRDFMKNPRSLEASQLPENWKTKIRSYVPQYSWIKHPFAPYQLTNNNARIKMYSDRVKVLEEKNNNAVTIGKKEILFTGGRVILNYAEDRIQIKHNEKPSREIINNIKSNGFRWSPSNKVWQRQITEQAFYKTSLLTGINHENFNKKNDE
jgi:hypothetical protein